MLSWQAVRCEVHGVRAPHRAHRAGDAGPGPRVPPALLRVRGVRPAAPEGRPVRHTQRSTLLQAGLREGDGRHADRHQSGEIYTKKPASVCTIDNSLGRHRDVHVSPSGIVTIHICGDDIFSVCVPSYVSTII
ncbi:hypothetical protein CEXT_12211 [Caerostris extrusa]|uniref:Uncharacterized protein n=1 Tax=Caerostris extrusa TaxID=172846 RepID=A0AAV4SL37_CAEEX|nr:hypothetical protein CEXT_12211 [Caerostris extrusa]